MTIVGFTRREYSPEYYRHVAWKYLKNEAVGEYVTVDGRRYRRVEDDVEYLGTVSFEDDDKEKDRGRVL